MESWAAFRRSNLQVTWKQRRVAFASFGFNPLERNRTGIGERQTPAVVSMMDEIRAFSGFDFVQPRIRLEEYDYDTRCIT